MGSVLLKNVEFFCRVLKVSIIFIYLVLLMNLYNVFIFYENFYLIGFFCLLNLSGRGFFIEE